MQNDPQNRKFDAKAQITKLFRQWNPSCQLSQQEITSSKQEITLDWKQNKFSVIRTDLRPFKGLHYTVLIFLSQQPDFSQDNPAMMYMDSLTKTCIQKHHNSLI